MTEQLIDFYCPACGEYSRVHWSILSPGDSTVTCLECGTRFVVQVGLEEIPESEQEANGASC